MKTKEELNALKKEAEKPSKKLHELTEDELAEVAGGDIGLDIAERVIRGDNGNGQGREHTLRTDGYDYGSVQNEAGRKPGNDGKFPE